MSLFEAAERQNGARYSSVVAIPPSSPPTSVSTAQRSAAGLGQLEVKPTPVQCLTRR